MCRTLPRLPWRIYREPTPIFPACPFFPLFWTFDLLISDFRLGPKPLAERAKAKPTRDDDDATTGGGERRERRDRMHMRERLGMAREGRRRRARLTDDARASQIWAADERLAPFRRDFVAVSLKSLGDVPQHGHELTRGLPVPLPRNR